MSSKLGRPKKHPSEKVCNTNRVIKLKVDNEIFDLVNMLAPSGYGKKTQYLLSLIYADAERRGFSPDSFGLRERIGEYGQESS